MMWAGKSGSREKGERYVWLREEAVRTQRTRAAIPQPLGPT